MGPGPRKTQVHTQFCLELWVIHRLSESRPQTSPCNVSLMESHISSAPGEPFALPPFHLGVPTSLPQPRARPGPAAPPRLALGPAALPQRLTFKASLEGFYDPFEFQARWKMCLRLRGALRAVLSVPATAGPVGEDRGLLPHSSPLYFPVWLPFTKLYDMLPTGV